MILIEIGTLFASICNFSLGIWVLKHRTKNSHTKTAFIVFSFITGLWSLSNFFLAVIPSFLVIMASYFTGTLVATSALYWVILFSKKKISRFTQFVIVLVSLIFVIVSLIPKGMVTEMVRENGQVYFLKDDLFFPLWTVFLAIIVILVWRLLWTSMRSANGIFREQLKLILFGAVGFGGSALVTDIIFPYLGLNSLTILDGTVSLLFTIPAAYAMVRYRFMDVKFVLRKGTVYGITLMIVLGVYIYFMFLLSRFAESFFSVNYQIASIIGVILIALGFNPLKKLVNNFLDSYVFKKQINSKAFLEKIRQQLDTKRPVEDFANSLRKEIKKNLKLEFAELVIPNYRPTGDWEIIEPEIKSLEKLIQNRSLLSFYFARNNDIIVAEEIPFRLEENDNKEEKELLEKISRLCRDLKIGIIAPFKFSEELIGLLVFGQKKDGKIYTIEDIDYIKNMRDESTYTLSGAITYYKAIWRIKNEYRRK